MRYDQKQFSDSRMEAKEEKRVSNYVQGERESLRSTTRPAQRRGLIFSSTELIGNS
jgi:hypothetical protein